MSIHSPPNTTLVICRDPGYKLMEPQHGVESISSWIKRADALIATTKRRVSHPQ